jgi:hypothetical protein
VDNQGRIWVKQGADKRHVTAREEMQRMFQPAGLVYADVVPVAGTSAADIDEKAFRAYFNRRYGAGSEFAGLPLGVRLPGAMGDVPDDESPLPLPPPLQAVSVAAKKTAPTNGLKGTDIKAHRCRSWAAL